MESLGRESPRASAGLMTGSSTLDLLLEGSFSRSFEVRDYLECLRETVESPFVVLLVGPFHDPRIVEGSLQGFQLLLVAFECFGVFGVPCEIL